MAPIDPLSPFSVKNTNGNNGKQRRLRFKQKLKLLKKLPGRLNQNLHLILSSNCSMKEKRHTRHCLRKKITREARRKEKAERDAIAEKILVEHLIKMIGIKTEYIEQDSAGFDTDYSDLELELKMVTELDFEEGIDLEEFRNSGLNIEEFMMSQLCLKESEYVVKLGTELDFEEGIDLEEFRNSGLNIEQFVMSQRRSKDSDYGTSGQPIKKKPKVSGPDSDKLKRKAWRRHGQEKNGTV